MPRTWSRQPRHRYTTGLLAVVVALLVPALRPAFAAAAPPVDNVFPVASQGATCTSDFVAGSHDGIDCFSVGNQIGAPLVAVESGTIGEVRLPVDNYVCGSTTGQGGNALFLIGQSGHSYYYGHVDVVMVKSGQSVQRGQTIATMGRSGNASCSTSVPHLHFEIKLGGGGTPFNPQPHVNSWARPTAQGLIQPGITGSITGLTNPIPVVGGDPYSVGAANGCVAAAGYNGYLALRIIKNDTIIVTPATHTFQTCNWAMMFNLPATKVCVEAYGNGSWHGLGCRGVASGAVGASGSTMTGSDGNGTIAGTASIAGFGGQIGVRTLVGTTTGPLSYSSASGPFTAQFNGAPAGSRVCAQANSYGLWVTLGCRGTASGTLTSVSGGRAIGTVNLPTFANPVTIRVYVNGQFVAVGLSSAGVGNRSYSVPFTAPAGASVCTKADGWGHLQSLGCRTT
jgi:hypothetical protein